MKKTYSTLPESMKNMEMFGFHWMEFVTSVPSPLYIPSLYKDTHASIHDIFVICGVISIGVRPVRLNSQFLRHPLSGTPESGRAKPVLQY